MDALTTALVMGDHKAVGQILDYIPKIDFDSTSSDVSLFETTIRYLGGLVSGTCRIWSIHQYHFTFHSSMDTCTNNNPTAYDLLTGPLSGIYGDNFTDVIKQAKHLADNLSIAFATQTGIPDNTLLWNPPRPSGSTSNGIATIGTLVMEWTRLSDITGDPKYGLLAQRGEEFLVRPRNPELGEPWPGLLGTDVSIASGAFLNGAGGWGGSDDSYYEYLIKMYLYDPVRFEEYKDRWIAAAESSIKYLVSHPTSRPDLTFLAMWENNKTLQFVSEHLACFNGGNFILGGLTLDEPRYVQFGLLLVDSCYETYTATVTGIGPEVFKWQDSLTPLNAKNNPAPPANQTGFYNASGFWITAPNYVLRPEVIESIYYAYRATGDPKYQDWAWDAYLAINTTCAAGSGYSSIRDVNSAKGGSFTDFQESFWFAEVLQYSYLIHAPVCSAPPLLLLVKATTAMDERLTVQQESPWQVKADHTNQFVYNTEAHPVRIFGGRERTARKH